MVGVSADPLSKKFDIDFFRDVPSRNLKGLATRSDGRLVGGPTLTEINAPAPAELLWCLAPTNDPSKFLVGTGPEGRILELTLNAGATGFTTRDVAKLDDPQVFAVKQLPDGSILAGTSPKGALYLIRQGKPVARVLLPVDSIFDLLEIDANTVLAATGNPGRIYRIDVRKFAAAGLVSDKITDAKILADRGITLFGEIRDRNVRRLAAFPDGRIIAGSSPKGNIYTFAPGGGAPIILQENHDAEVTDLLPQPNGDLYASVVFSESSGESRITPAAQSASAGNGKQQQATDAPAPAPVEVPKFSGRSALVWLPANGFPETLASRAGVAFYRLVRVGDTLVMAGGDTGELLGYDLKAQLSLTFPGSISAQLNGIVPLAGAPGRFLVLRNNAPGLAVLDFGATGVREAETHRIDLQVPSELGAVRFSRLRNLDAAGVSIDAQVNNGTDEVEGWGPWTPMKLDPDGGWRAANLRGRSVRLRIRVPNAAAPQAATASSNRNLEFDRAALYVLPQDRRPILQDFRVLSPNFGLVVAVNQPPSPIVTVGQLLQSGSGDDDKHKDNFNSSQVVPQPGAQVVLWNVVDPDNDNLAATFSIRRDGDKTWTDVVTDTTDSYAQFDTSNLPDGVYFTRLVVKETAPRPPSQRLSKTFETDNLIVDHTPPEILDASAKRVGNSVVVTVHGRDQLSLLDSIDVLFSNGVHETVQQPVDGILDGREETFSLDLPVAQVSNATSVEVTLYDAAGNGTARRLTWLTPQAAK